jgi:hypothetical protein
LNDFRTGSHRLVVVDDAFREWLDSPKPQASDSSSS